MGGAMGVAAAHPVEAIRVQKQRGPLATACVADMQGWRDSHEDAHFMCQPDGGLGWASFGVLDGHGGQKAAILGAEQLPAALKKATKGRKPNEGPGVGKLQAAFEEVDANLRANMGNGSEPSGTTVISAGVKIQPDGKYSCYLANAGDSRGILVRLRSPGCDTGIEHLSTSVNVAVVTEKGKANDEEGAEEADKIQEVQEEPEKGTKAEEAAKLLAIVKIGSREFEILASIDNKPDRSDEKKRIEAAGGAVSGDDCPRVDGNLAVSRGFADFEYKSSSGKPPSEQKVSCVPELYEMRDMEKGDLVILACDGIFDVLSNEELVRMIMMSFDAIKNCTDFQSMSCSDVIGRTCSNVLQACLQKGSRDNMTMMLLQVGDMDYVKLVQEPTTESKPVKQAIMEQELSLPTEDKLKKHIEDAAIKKSYNVFLEMCKKGGCDLSKIPNIELVLEPEEKKSSSGAAPAMTQKERLQKKLEERKLTNQKTTPPPPEKLSGKAAPPTVKEEPPAAVEAKADSKVPESKDAEDDEVVEGGSKNKKKKNKKNAAAEEAAAKKALEEKAAADAAVAEAAKQAAEEKAAADAAAAKKAAEAEVKDAVDGPKSKKKGKNKK